MKKSYSTVVKRALFVRRAVLGGTVLEYIIVGLFYLMLSLAYTNFAIVGGDSRLFISEPGDATAGITWWTAEKTNNVFDAFGHTDAVNYPKGADLRDPTQLTNALIAGPLWVITRFVSPYMGTNIMELIAFMLISMTMYVLMKRLTGKWYIAFFAGFAATFFPYHLFKTVNHIGNIFSWVFVFEMGAFLYLWRRPSWKSSLLVAISVAAGYFTDGYYLLLSTVFAATLSVGLVLANIVLREPRERTMLVIKHLLLSVGMLSLMTVPIIYAQMTAGSQITKTLDRSTATIKTELKVYASTKLDFLTPPPHNPFFHGQSWYYDMLRQKSQHSNPVESTLYIGYVILGLCFFGAILLIIRLVAHKRFKNITKLSARDDRWFVILSCVVIVSMPVMLSFMGPDKLYKFGLSIPTLAGVLTDHIALWRVLARFILPMHVMLVVYASFTLYILLNSFVRGRKRGFISIGIVVILTVLCGIEYATTINTPVFDLSKMPRLYSYLKQRTDIDVLGELPLQDSPVEVNGYYATAQYIHGKKLVNNHVSKYNVGQFSALGTDDNPDTIDFLKERGADAVITRDKQCTSKEWGNLLYSEKINLSSPYDTPPSFGPSGDNYMCLYKLNEQRATDPSFVVTSASYARENTGEYSTTLGTPTVTMKVMDDEQRPIKDRRATISVHAFSTGKLTYSWTAKQNGEVLASGSIAGADRATITVIAQTNDSVTIDFTLEDKRIQYVPEDIRLTDYISTLVPTTK